MRYPMWWHGGKGVYNLYCSQPECLQSFALKSHTIGIFIANIFDVFSVLALHHLNSFFLSFVLMVWPQTHGKRFVLVVLNYMLKEKLAFSLSDLSQQHGFRCHLVRPCALQAQLHLGFVPNISMLTHLTRDRAALISRWLLLKFLSSFVLWEMGPDYMRGRRDTWWWQKVSDVDQRRDAGHVASWGQIKEFRSGLHLKAFYCIKSSQMSSSLSLWRVPVESN